MDPLIILIDYRFVPLDVSDWRRLFMDEAKRVTEFMTHSCTELQIGHVISHPTVVHGWLILADCMATSANVRPVAISVEGDADVGITRGVTLHPFEGYVRVASPFIGKLLSVSICIRS